MKLRLLTALGLALMAAALVLQYRPDEWRPRVTEEALHAPTNHWPRPSHVDAPKGHFGEVLESDWAALRTLEDNWQGLGPDATLDCTRAARGEDPRALFGHRCREWLKQARRHLATIEAATRTAEAGPPERFDPLRSDELHYESQVLIAGRIPVFDALALELDATGEEEHAQALDSCVTALAVARDLEWGQTTMGYQHAERVAGNAFYPCAQALLHVSKDRQARFAAELARLSKGRPPLSHGFELERTFVFLRSYGGTLPAQTLARVDPGLKAQLERRKGQFKTDELRKNWPELARHHDALVAAARLPVAQRDAAFEAQGSALNASGYHAYLGVDAVFEALAVIAGPPEPPAHPHSRFEPADGGLTVTLDLPFHELPYKDGGTAGLANSFRFTLPGPAPAPPPTTPADP